MMSSFSRSAIGGVLVRATLNLCCPIDAKRSTSSSVIVNGLEPRQSRSVSILAVGMVRVRSSAWPATAGGGESNAAFTAVKSVDLTIRDGELVGDERRTPTALPPGELDLTEIYPPGSLASEASL